MIKQLALLLVAIAAIPWAAAENEPHEDLAEEFTLPAAQNISTAAICDQPDSSTGKCSEKSTSVEEIPPQSTSEYFQMQRTSTHLTEDPTCVSFIGPKSAIDAYCVYTSSTFANGRGISWFARPDSHQHIINSMAFKNQTLHDDNAMQYNDPPYERRDVPGKGVGLFATRPLKRGDTIFTALPLLLVEGGSRDDLREADRLKLQAMGADLLPEKTKEVFYKMMGHFGGDLVDDIMNTNMFQVFFGPDDTAFTALIPETGRMNHACRPNVQYNFDDVVLSHVVKAARDIEVDEELTVSYIDTLQTFEERQDALKDGWGFTCTCSLCAASAASDMFRKESDRRVRQIIRQGQLMRDFLIYAPGKDDDSVRLQPRKELKDEEEEEERLDSAQIPEPEELLALAKSHLRLFELEKLHGRIAVAYRLATLMSTAMEDRDLALGYGLQAIEHMAIWTGPGTPQVQRLIDLVTNVEKHWTWGLAKNMFRVEKEVPDR